MPEDVSDDPVGFADVVTTVTVTLNLSDIGFDVVEGTQFTLQLRDKDELHETAGRLIDPNIVETGTTDADGNATIDIVSSDDYTTGSGVYTLNVPGFEAVHALINADITALAMLKTGNSPPDRDPAGQLGWIPRAADDDAPADPRDGLGDLVVATGVLRVWHEDTSQWVTISGGGSADSVAWADITGKPTFAPSDAEANVNADWDATSGDAEILNKPTIPEQRVPALAAANRGHWLIQNLSSDALAFALPPMQYHGAWTSSRTYTYGDVVTHDDALWVLRTAAVTTTSTNQEPSGSSTVWDEVLARDVAWADVTGKPARLGAFTAADETKLDGIAAGAEVNEQADWNVIDNQSDAFIRNKPNIQVSTGAPGYAYHQAVAIQNPNVTATDTDSADAREYTIIDSASFPAGIIADRDFVSEWQATVYMDVEDAGAYVFALETTHVFADSTPDLVHEREYVDRLSRRVLTGLSLSVFDSRSVVPAGTPGVDQAVDITVKLKVVRDDGAAFQIRKLYVTDGEADDDSTELGRATFWQIGTERDFPTELPPTDGSVSLLKLDDDMTARVGNIPSSPANQANKVWKTNATGVPAWRDDATGGGGGASVSAHTPVSGDQVLKGIDIDGTDYKIAPADGTVGAGAIIDDSIGGDALADDSVDASHLDTTGTANGTTFLRGDMAWAEPADGSFIYVASRTAREDLAPDGDTTNDGNVENRLVYQASDQTFWRMTGRNGADEAIWTEQRDGEAVETQIGNLDELTHGIVREGEKTWADVEAADGQFVTGGSTRPADGDAAAAAYAGGTAVTSLSDLPRRAAQNVLLRVPAGTNISERRFNGARYHSNQYLIGTAGSWDYWWEAIAQFPNGTVALQKSEDKYEWQGDVTRSAVYDRLDEIVSGAGATKDDDAETIVIAGGGGGSGPWADAEALIDDITGGSIGDISFSRQGTGAAANLIGTVGANKIALSQLDNTARAIMGRVPADSSSQANKVWKTDASGTAAWRDDATGGGGGGVTVTKINPNDAQDDRSNGRAAQTVWAQGSLVAARTAIGNIANPSDGDLAFYRAYRNSSRDNIEFYTYQGSTWWPSGEVSVSRTDTSGVLADDTGLPPNEVPLSEWSADYRYPTGYIVEHDWGLWIRVLDGTQDDSVNPEPGSSADQGHWSKVGGQITYHGNADENASPIGGFQLREGAFTTEYAFKDDDAQARLTTVEAEIDALEAGNPIVPEWVSGTAYATGELVTYHGRVWRCVSALAGSVTDPAESAHFSAVGGWSGAWRADRSYSVGNIVLAAGEFWITFHNVAENEASPESNSKWQQITNDLGGFRGVWQGGATYYRGDIVYQSDHFYVCVAESRTTNQGPVSDVDNWDPVGIFRDNWDSSYRYEAGDQVLHDGKLWGSIATITSGSASEPGVHASWKRLDNADVDPVPLSAVFSPTNVTIRYQGAATGADIPLASDGANPYAGLISPAEKTKLAGIDADALNADGVDARVLPEARAGNTDAWNPSKLPDLVSSASATNVELRYDGEATGAQIAAADASSAGLLLPADKTAIDTIADLTARIAALEATPAGGSVTERMLSFDLAGIHSGNGSDYWHRTNLLASDVPANAEVAFEFPYTWSPTPRLWSRWPGAPTQVATEWWLQDVTPDGSTTTIDRIAAPSSSFTSGGSTHYHPFGHIDTTEHPRTVDIEEVALIVDSNGYLCFCTQGERPTVGDHPNAAPATGIRMLWRT